MEFPAQYPALKAPSFDIIKAKNLDSVAQTNIVQAMKDKSLKHVKKSQACLEPCIRQLRDTLDEVHFNSTQEEAEKSGSPTKEIDRLVALCYCFCMVSSLNSSINHHRELSMTP